jgi:hypothetical protein
MDKKEIMRSHVSVPILPGVRVTGPPNKPFRPWHWAAIAALVVVAGCASGERPPAETTSSGAYTTTSSPPSPPPPPAQAQAQPAASQCNPNYSGACVPIDRGDVDCAGGTGNGAEYVQGPVYVVGQDIYGLAADGNRIGCEPDVVNAGPEDLSECDPNYSGACVPIASEVDCEGGNGNGPAYVRGPVNVVGEDIYGLDRNSDGVGCESSVVNAGLEDLSGCDPNYSGACVPIARDVDCTGGNGNGPEYVRGPVNVVGEDIYGLDADGDGVGCQSRVVNAAWTT